MIKQFTIVLLALSSSALTQAKRCQTGPKGSGPDLEGFEMSMIVLHDVDASWSDAVRQKDPVLPSLTAQLTGHNYLVRSSSATCKTFRI